VEARGGVVDRRVVELVVVLLGFNPSAAEVYIKVIYAQRLARIAHKQV
jgi:hypothetical protein